MKVAHQPGTETEFSKNDSYLGKSSDIPKVKEAFSGSYHPSEYRKSENYGVSDPEKFENYREYEKKSAGYENSEVY